MGKMEFIQLQIIDNTQLQQLDDGGIRSNENLILVEIAVGPPFGQKFNPVGGSLFILENSWFIYIGNQRKSSKNETPYRSHIKTELRHTNIRRFNRVYQRIGNVDIMCLCDDFFTELRRRPYTYLFNYEALPGFLGNRGKCIFSGEQGNTGQILRGTGEHRQYLGTGKI